MKLGKEALTAVLSELGFSRVQVRKTADHHFASFCDGQTELLWFHAVLVDEFYGEREHAYVLIDPNGNERTFRAADYVGAVVALKTALASWAFANTEEGPRTEWPEPDFDPPAAPSRYDRLLDGGIV